MGKSLDHKKKTFQENDTLFYKKEINVPSTIQNKRQIFMYTYILYTNIFILHMQTLPVFCIK